MPTAHLLKAMRAKNDEFYTQWADIEREVMAYYNRNKKIFRGKTILCPCDDPEWSNFTKFFASKFREFGLKKLISTSFAIESRQYKVGYQLSLFEQENEKFDKKKTRTHGKIYTLDKDTNNDGEVNIEDLEWEYLQGDGDFQSPEVQALLAEADFIITNPPFSLFRDFLAWIVTAKQPNSLQPFDRTYRTDAGLTAEQPLDRITGFTGLGKSCSHGAVSPCLPNADAAALLQKTPKKFLIIGNKNAITYKEVFPLIKENKLWAGATEWSGGLWFETKDVNDVDKVIDGVNMKNVSSVWFTNIDHGRRHEPLALMTMEHNLKFSKHKEIKGKKAYDTYDNYHAIEVPFTDSIPSDYPGVMGVPISFLDKYCPEQFEIVGATESEGKGFSGALWMGGIAQPVVDGRRIFKRLFIKHRHLAK